MWRRSTPMVMARTPGRMDRSPRLHSPMAGGRAPGNNPATTGKGDLRYSSRPIAPTQRANGGTPALDNKSFRRENGAATLLGNGSHRSLLRLPNPSASIFFYFYRLRYVP